MKELNKIVSILLLILTFVTSGCSQQKASPEATATGNIDGVEITINYHQPSVKGRKIMNGLVPYGKVWRTGANNATTIEFSDDVKIEGQLLPAGKYALFTIPTEKEWTIIFNKTYDQWGAYKYQEKEDALRIKTKPISLTKWVETLEFNVLDNKVEFKWENTAIEFSVNR